MTMQSLDVEHPRLPDLQFVLMVAALCTSELPSLNVPAELRTAIFDRCWALLHDTPAPTVMSERVLDLRPATELALAAMVQEIRGMLRDAGIAQITWNHPPSAPSRQSSPEALPLIERLQQLYPPDDPPSNV